MEPIPFREFNEDGDVRVYYHGLLPHWRQKGSTYFVTYRLADALPIAVNRAFEHERQQWLKHRGIDGNLSVACQQLSIEDQRLYERTMATKLNKYLDAGHGSCVLRQEAIAKLVANSLLFFHGQRVLTGDFIVMPNHVHALLKPILQFELEDVLQAIKSYTANRINHILGTSGRLWQRESYDHIVRDAEQLAAFQKYIFVNPKKANLTLGSYIYRAGKFVPDE